LAWVGLVAVMVLAMVVVVAFLSIDLSGVVTIPVSVGTLASASALVPMTWRMTLDLDRRNGRRRRVWQEEKFRSSIGQ